MINCEELKSTWVYHSFIDRCSFFKNKKSIDLEWIYYFRKYKSW